jgi:hypothetical protein
VLSDWTAFTTWIAELSVDAIETDEEQFLDRSRTRAYVVHERVMAG